MKISQTWISDFLPGQLPPAEQLAEKLSASLAEVSNWQERNAWLNEKIIVAKIISLRPHPQADHLQIAQLSNGQRHWQVISAATNIRRGQIVPLALPGATVQTPKGDLKTITAREFRGQISAGMMTSAQEVGAGSDQQGIWILPSDWEKHLGQPLIKILPALKDVVWEIENKALTHRPDCFGQLGLAREIAASLKITMKVPPYFQNHWQPHPKKPWLPLQIQVKAGDLCPRYAVLALRNIKVTASPLWLQQRLLSVGLRPINNIVDATNYVMMELGQPMHAFDAQKLTDKTIVVRRAREGEIFVGLNQRRYQLSHDDLVIANHGQPIALAGIFGGENSEIDEKSQEIILEAANFQKATIRRSARRHGLRTDASLRFEKGLDPNLAIPALKLTLALIRLTSPATIASPLIDHYPQPVKSKTINLHPQFVNQILGGKIRATTMAAIFKRLDLGVKKKRGLGWQLTIPTFRPDLKNPIDLVEEVGRFYGYHRLPLQLPQRPLRPTPLNRAWQNDQQARQLLASLGFDEIYNYSFVGQQLLTAARLKPKIAIPLRNPLSPALAYLAPSLVPSLLATAKLNLANFNQVRLFSVAHVFRYQANQQQMPAQPKMIVALLSRRQVKTETIFRQIKGHLEIFWQRLQLPPFQLKSGTLPAYFHPGQSGQIFLGRQLIGYLGLLHPLVAKNFNFGQNKIALFELNFDQLSPFIGQGDKYHPPYLGAVLKIDISLKAKNWRQAQEKVARILADSLLKISLRDHFEQKYTLHLELKSNPKSRQRWQKLLRIINQQE